MLSGFNLLRLEQRVEKGSSQRQPPQESHRPPLCPNCGHGDQMRNLSTSQAIFPSEFFHFSPQWTKCLLGARMAEGTGRDDSSWTLPT